MTRLKQQARVMEHVEAQQRGAFFDRLPHVRQFRAWRLAGGLSTVTEARRVSIDAHTLEEACAQASHAARHKDTLFVQEIDEAKRVNRVHAFLIQEGAAVWRKNTVTGLSERKKPLKAKPLFVLPVEAFEPARPFNALRDDPTGVDADLIEGKAL